jgi:hypothetical protein
MAVTKRSDIIYVDQLQEAISAAFAGMIALYGTGAAILSRTLPTIGDAGTKLKGGDTIKVPYFDAIGEMDDPAEGDALTPVKLTESSETSTVVHSGKAGEITNWALLTAMFSDPYAEYGKQFAAIYQRRIDKGLIDKAAASSLVFDQSVNGSGFIDWDSMVNAVSLWGDEGGMEDIVLFVVHSKVMADLYKLKDSTGRPLLLEPTDAALPRFRGIPVKMSDRIAPAAGIYSNMILKRGALAAWVNGEPNVESDKDILADSFITAIHTYHVEHLYKRPPTGTKPGVVVLKTKAST